MKALKIYGNVWRNASRDKRELSVLRELGLETAVMSKGEPGDKGRHVITDGYDNFLFTTRPLGNSRFLRPVNRVYSIFWWAKRSRAFKAELLTCHDLPALMIGYLSTLFRTKKNKPLLVYDSHEFEIGRSGERSRIQKFFVTHTERFLIKRCALAIMVNNSIASEVVAVHKLKKRPAVVRNIPHYMPVDESVIAETRSKLCAEAGFDKDSFIAMYHGGVVPNRGVETLMEVTAINKSIVSVVLGNGSDAYISELKQKADSMGISDRIFFHPAVPAEELWKYAGAANAGMVILKNVCINHYYSLPNKLFENIQSLTPVVGSDFPEIRRIIKDFDIGLTCDPADPEAMSKCLERMRTEPELSKRFVSNLRKAKEELCWEKESLILAEAYREILPKQ